MIPDDVHLGCARTRTSAPIKKLRPKSLIASPAAGRFKGFLSYPFESPAAL